MDVVATGQASRDGGDSAEAMDAEKDAVFYDAAAEQLLVRARIVLGWKRAIPDLSEVHLIVDGARVDGRVRNSEICFRLNAEAQVVWLVSPPAKPSDIGELDKRLLGIALAQIVIDEGFSASIVIKSSDERLGEGFHEAETENHRWTNGRARLPCELWKTCESVFFLRLELSGLPVARWMPSN